MNSVYIDDIKRLFSKDGCLYLKNLKKIKQFKSISSQPYMGNENIYEVCDDKKNCDYIAKKMTSDTKEFQILYNFNNFDNIPKIYDIWVCQEGKEYDKKDISYIVVMEKINGKTLQDYLIENQEINMNKCRKLIKKIISVIRSLHSLDIIHGDLNLKNIIIDIKEDIKLIDFGESTYTKNSKKKEEDLKQFIDYIGNLNPAFLEEDDEKDIKDKDIKDIYRIINDKNIFTKEEFLREFSKKEYSNIPKEFIETVYNDESIFPDF